VLADMEGWAMAAMENRMVTDVKSVFMVFILLL
jgi:hypothetical protein